MVGTVTSRAPGTAVAQRRGSRSAASTPRATHRSGGLAQGGLRLLLVLLVVLLRAGSLEVVAPLLAWLRHWERKRVSDIPPKRGESPESPHRMVLGAEGAPSAPPQPTNSSCPLAGSPSHPGFGLVPAQGGKWHLPPPSLDPNFFQAGVLEMRGKWEAGSGCSSASARKW